jgi:hypothetical protein
MNTNVNNKSVGNSAPISAEEALAQIWNAMGENAKLQAQVSQATAVRLLQVETGGRDSAAALATAVLELQKLTRDLDGRLRNLESRMEKSYGVQAGVTPVLHSMAGAGASR